MPELPEIETICRALKSQILNLDIIQVKKQTNLNLRQEIPHNIEQQLENQKIIDIERRAKYILIHLNNANTLIIHLGMSGKLLIREKDYIYQKHDHFILYLSNKQKIIYNDPRRFGLITISNRDSLNNHPLFINLGIEPLSSSFDANYLHSILKNKKQSIKSTIMNNKNLVGVGNIYALEALFLSKILPTRESNSLSKKEISSLYENIIDVLKQAIKQGGSTIKDYSSISGESGYFQHSFKVYNQEGKQCKICSQLILRTKQSGRSSFFCPKCQE